VKERREKREERRKTTGALPAPPTVISPLWLFFGFLSSFVSLLSALFSLFLDA
jgi:hypothetical protein